MQNFREFFKNRAHTQSVSTADMIVLCAYKSLNAKSNGNKLDIFLHLLSKSFTPVTNINKLANGAKPFQKLRVLLNGGTLYNNVGSSLPTLKDVLVAFNAPAEDNLAYWQLIYDARDKINSSETLPTTFYSYVVVDDSILTPAQIAVQATHAGIELGFYMRDDGLSIEDLHLVLVKKPTDVTMEELSTFYMANGYQHTIFVEPDLDGAFTAIATYPVNKRNRSDFKGLQLVGRD